MKFTVNDETEERVQLQLVEHEWGVSISRVRDDKMLLELSNQGICRILTLGAELLNCAAGIVK